MSGIVGQVRWDNDAVAPETLAAMLGAVAHRGPHGISSWREGPAGLGHLMLHTTPESLHEQQPLSGRGSAIILTADIRLDNRSELYEQLSTAGRPLAELTDPDLVLLAHERWGVDCPEKLLGDFAFAIWDKQRQSLFCARDHLGVKPFYYYDSPRCFAFASEIKALLCLPEVPRAVNEQRVAEFLCVLDSTNKDDTFYRHIWRVPPGHSLTRNSTGLSLRRYWELDRHKEIYLRSDAEYAERFHELFMVATAERLRSASPVATILSGGLDSACVTRAAREIWQGTAPIHTLSAYFTGSGDTDERPFIDAVLEGGRFSAQRIDGNDLKITPAEVKTIVQQLEEPFWYVFQFVLWRLYALAQQANARVLLDGIDGDSVLAGVSKQYLPSLLLSGRWPGYLAEITSQLKLAPTSSPARSIKQGLGALWRNSGGLLLAAPLRLAWNNRRRTESGRLAALNPQLAQDPALHQRLQRNLGILNNGWSTPRAAHVARLVDGPFPYHLEMLNRAASYFGLEYRHPFLDKRLVEFCVALPARQRLYHGHTRVVMRRGLEYMLPETVSRRVGKGAVMHHYQHDIIGTGAPSLAEIALKKAPGLDSYVNTTLLQQAQQQYLAADGGRRSVWIWHSTSLALWLLYSTPAGTGAASA